MLLCRHSGLDPWFDRLTVLGNVEGLTTLSEVEGKSSSVSQSNGLDAGRRSRLQRGSRPA
jgi:hypothetical protein